MDVRKWLVKNRVAPPIADLGDPGSGSQGSHLLQLLWLSMA